MVSASASRNVGSLAMSRSTVSPMSWAWTSMVRNGTSGPLGERAYPGSTHRLLRGMTLDTRKARLPVCPRSPGLAAHQTHPRCPAASMVTTESASVIAKRRRALTTVMIAFGAVFGCCFGVGTSEEVTTGVWWLAWLPGHDFKIVHFVLDTAILGVTIVSLCAGFFVIADSMWTGRDWASRKGPVRDVLNNRRSLAFIALVRLREIQTEIDQATSHAEAGTACRAGPGRQSAQPSRVLLADSAAAAPQCGQPWLA